MLSNGERVGHYLQTPGRHEMHHLEGGRTAIDNDGVTFLAQIDGLACNCAFLIDIDRFRDAKGTCGQVAKLWRMHRLGSAAHTAQFPLDVKRCDITPDRCLGRIGQFGNVLHRHHRLFLNGAQDDAMAFALVHGVLLTAIFRKLRLLSIKFDQKYQCCGAQ